MSLTRDKYFISVIIPVLNEENYVADLLDSIKNQVCTNITFEVLIIDGMSSDNTRNLIRPFLSSSFRLIDNVKRSTPDAFNIGLTDAKGDFVAILGAHCIYESNYLQECLKALLITGSVGCSGKVITGCKENTIESNIVSVILNSSFGVSNHSFRTIKYGYVDSVNFPVYKKEVLIEMGGYDTKMLRNQDNVMNSDLISKGYKLYVTDKTSCQYFVPGSVIKLLRYAFRNGKWNVSTFFSNRRAMKFYHFVPLFFFLSVIFGVLLSILDLETVSSVSAFGISVLLLIHVLLSITFSIDLFKRCQLFSFFLAPCGFMAFHLSYGLGSFIGLTRLVLYKD